MTEARRFLYRGAIVIEGWPEQMLAAQEIATRRLGDREVPRVRYGDESDALVSQRSGHWLSTQDIETRVGVGCGHRALSGSSVFSPK